MENYIESGITWIGKIPSDWKITKIKAMASLSGRIGWQGLTSEEYTDEGAFLITGVDFDNGIINWDSCVHVPMKRWKEAVGVQIKENDLLITKDGTVGKVALAKNMPYETSLNSGVLLIRPNKKYDNKFLFYVLKSDEFWTWFNLDNSGNSTITHLYQHNFNNFSFSYPSLEEQKKISAYLDEKVSNIDNLIKDYEQQIFVLKKYRKSLITETITKGLDLTVESKDSNVDWIDVMPSFWGVSKIKYVASFINGYAFDSEEMVSENGFPIVRITEVTNDGLDLSDCLFIENDRGLKNYLIKNNDLLIALSGATVGKNCVVTSIDEKMYINQRVAIIRSEFNKYLNYVFQSSGFDDYIVRISYGSAQPNISCNDIGNFYIPIPPIEEREKIVEFLDSACAKLSNDLKHKEDAVEKLKNYKKSLIYEYVTGKKRVEVK